jgi:hypothetical protein
MTVRAAISAVRELHDNEESVHRLPEGILI